MTLASETPSSPGASGKRLTSAAPFFIEAPRVEQIGDGDGLVAVRAPPTDSQLAHEGPAFGAALLTKGAYATRFALIDGHRSARPAGGNLDNGAGGDLVSPSPCGCPARMAA